MVAWCFMGGFFALFFPKIPKFLGGVRLGDKSVIVRPISNIIILFYPSLTLFFKICIFFFHTFFTVFLLADIEMVI